MKKYKLHLVSIIITVFTLGSCSSDDNCSTNNLSSYLIECPWSVNSADIVYTYTFKNDRSLIIDDGLFERIGTWDVNTNSEGLNVVSIYGSINDKWEFANCDYKKKKVTSKENTKAKIRQNCNSGCTRDVITSRLVNCSWSVNIYDKRYIYTFKSDKTFIIERKSSIKSKGTWRIGTDTEGYFVVTIDDKSLNEFDDEWRFSKCSVYDINAESRTNDGAEIIIYCKQ